MAETPAMNIDQVDISPKKDNGVLKQILKEGEGDDLPGQGSEVFVHYTGRLLNGEKFDSSKDRDELFNFKLGEGEDKLRHLLGQGEDRNLLQLFM